MIATLEQRMDWAARGKAALRNARRWNGLDRAELPRIEDVRACCATLRDGGAMCGCGYGLANPCLTAIGLALDVAVPA